MGRSLDVFLNQELTGRLSQDDHGQILFSYHETWLNNPQARALSQSLPLQGAPFSRNECRPFFSGVLPDEAKREIIARNLGVSSRNDFSLLEQLGGECAGAVSLVPAGSRPEFTDGRYRSLSEQDLSSILKLLPRRPLMAGEDAVRLSLAGAQDKIAVRVEAGEISLPLNGAPSTHIIKPAIEQYEGVVFNEAFCMLLAKELGIPTAKVSAEKVLGTDFLLVERYDRIHDTAGNVQRHHQEDFCQALGIVPERKYQVEGGPSLVQCVDLVRRVCSTPVVELRQLLSMILFNLLIGNNDAHGKNFSLLYRDKSNSLAPLYDAVSTAYYPALSPQMAMKLGGAALFEDVSLQHLDKLAEQAGLGRALLRARLKDLAQQMLEALSTVDITHPVADELRVLIAKRCQKVLGYFT